MQVQRVQNNNYTTNFGASVSQETTHWLRNAMSDISRDRFATRLKNMQTWGQKDSVVSYCIQGLNKDKFVLTNPRLGDKEVAITEKTNNMLTTFFDKINEEEIVNAEKALSW